jgi:enoyl-CoA hydratase
MSYTTISYVRRGPVVWVTLNRPEVMNALCSPMIDEMIDALKSIQGDAELRVVVLTGAGAKAFCAGADLKEVRTWLDGATMPGKPDFLDRLTSFFEALRALPKPVIAAVNGIAVAGGLELVMACDLVLAAENAVFGDAHSNFGLFPGAGGAALLPRRIGINRAKYLLFTGDVVSAHEMMAFGVVNRVAATSDLASTAQELAERLASKSPTVLRKMKEVVNRAPNQTESAALQDEMRTLREHLRSADVREGLAAFMEKRSPDFHDSDAHS